jgi:deoxycytidylate deaminase
MHGTRAIAQGETRDVMTSETYCLCCTLFPCVMVAEIIMAMLADVPE